MAQKSWIVPVLLSLAAPFCQPGCAVSQSRTSGPLLPAHLPELGQRAKEVRIKTSDGWILIGDLYVPQRRSAGAVVLLHQRGGQGSDWTYLCRSLQQAGITALAIDQRGAGRSTQGPGPIGEDAPWDTHDDIAAAIASVKGKGPVGLAGASYGANNVLIYAALHPRQIRSIALLSPGANYHGLDALAAAPQYGGSAVIFHDRDDAVAGEGPRRIDATLKGRDHRLILLTGSEHGTGLLGSNVVRDITRYFRLRFRHGAE